MVNVLITGANSFIGESFKKFMMQFSEYTVDVLDVKSSDWEKYDFTKYDIVYHVAGIAHQKETPENTPLYYKVNRDLAIDIAKKAKESNVKQFIFMSSMSVYGLDYSKELITKDTPLNPKTNYGKSKLEAEVKLNELNCDDFNVVILRPPMVYGDGAPGNLSKLLKAVRMFHIFPKINNERSSIHIDKLCSDVKNICDSKTTNRIYLLQNDDYMCTYEIVKKTMANEGVKVFYTSFFNPIIKFLIGKIGLITKAFGNLKYKKESVQNYGGI